jgi:flagellar motor switch protein FliN/FliY
VATDDASEKQEERAQAGPFSETGSVAPGEANVFSNRSTDDGIRPDAALGLPAVGDDGGPAAFDLSDPLAAPVEPEVTTESVTTQAAASAVASPPIVEPAWGPATDFGMPSFQPVMDPNEMGLDLLLDIPLQVSVELGRTRLTVSEILSLRVGSVLELDKMAGEPGDVLVNGTLIARGEVVVVDEKFGIRIVEVLPAARRLASVA